MTTIDNRTLPLSHCLATIYSREPAPSTTSSQVLGCWVILLGFMGASARNMERLSSAMLEVLGGVQGKVKVLAVTAPISFVLKQGLLGNWEEGPYAALAEDVIRLTQEEEAGAGVEPILVHASSQNGAFAYRALVGNRTRRPIQGHARWRARVAGVVFDSAPVALTPAAVDSAVWSALGPVQGRLVTAALRIAIGGEQEYAERMQRQKDMYTGWFLGQDPVAAPLLFLFSYADRISSNDYIQMLIVEKRKGGTAVQWHDFGGSAHVQHLSAYTAEYRLQLGQFMRSLPTLRAWGAPPEAEARNRKLDSKL